MRHLTFSKVKRAHGLLQFLWPVQSWCQAKIMAATYAVGLPLMALALNQVDAREPTWDTILASALCGTWALFLYLPATLEVTTRGEARHFIGEVSELLQRYGYERCGHSLHFAGRVPRWLPSWLRWLRCPDTELDLSAQGHVIVLHGPRPC
jgi:hypothetical protein